MSRQVERKEQAVALAVRDACARAAAEAWERAGMSGLCEEGRIDMALDAIRTLDVAAVLESVPNGER